MTAQTKDEKKLEELYFEIGDVIYEALGKEFTEEKGFHVISTGNMTGIIAPPNSFGYRHKIAVYIVSGQIGEEMFVSEQRDRLGKE